jgi:16S rRNA processing protein RimM
MKNIVIAKITSAHGIKGLVKILSFAANPADFAKYSGKIFDEKNNLYKVKIINQVPGGNNDFFVAKVEGIEDRNAAEKLGNTELFIKRSDLKKVKKDEFYYVDLIGLDVLNVDRKKIGKVLSVNDFGAGGVVEIGFDESLNRIENFAFTNQIFPEIDIEKGFLIIDFPEEIEAKDNE